VIHPLCDPPHTHGHPTFFAAPTSIYTKVHLLRSVTFVIFTDWEGRRLRVVPTYTALTCNKYTKTMGAQQEQNHLPPPPTKNVSGAIAYYGLCSSCLLIVNKVALHILPAPVFLLSLQLWFAVVFVYALRATGMLTVEPLRWRIALKFLPVVVSFLGTLFANAKVLQFSNVETFITFRSSTPLVLCLCDYLFLGRHLPSMRSVASLFGLLVSSAGYALVDHAFDVRAYTWLAIWFVFFTTYEVVVKHLCDTVAVDNWTRVVYTNAMAGSMLALAIPFVKGEHAAVASVGWTTAGGVSTLLTSCLIGIGVSHSAYVMRSACSATLSAVVGILCKGLTVLINMVMWDKHASIVELMFLSLGLMAGAYYKQAPLRKVIGCAGGGGGEGVGASGVGAMVVAADGDGGKGVDAVGVCTDCALPLPLHLSSNKTVNADGTVAMTTTVNGTTFVTYSALGGGGVAGGGGGGGHGEGCGDTIMLQRLTAQQAAERFGRRAQTTGLVPAAAEEAVMVAAA
jgi:solute carrier family 35